MRISDWSSDVCSSDLLSARRPPCNEADRRRHAAVRFISAPKGSGSRLGSPPRFRQHRAVTGNDDHIHLILPDATERAACFRALAAGGTRIVRAFANADAWLDAEVAAGAAHLQIGRASCRERGGAFV